MHNELYLAIHLTPLKELITMQNSIIILDFGSQYTQLIARRIRELNVYCEIHPYHTIPELNDEIKGIVLSGSPFSVRDPQAPNIDLSKIMGKIPVLGICFGAQYIAQNLGGNVIASQIREYGRANLSYIAKENVLLKGLSDNTQVWMSHADTIDKLPNEYEIIASTASVKIGGFKDKNTCTYGIQFHPEVFHTTEGKQLIRNFVVDICKAQQNWTSQSYIETTIEYLKSTIKNDAVVMGLSGGVDSTVAAMLLQKAIGSQLYCIFVDNGLLRKNEFEKVLNSYKDMGLNVKGVDAADLFLYKLNGVSDPEKKRKIIGKLFIEVFNSEAKKINNVQWLGQGTIYPDVIESISVNGPSATIKSHHNVGGLPQNMELKVIEPLKYLFKDEVREVGHTLGIEERFLKRHPFPGPGLSIRLIGEINKEKLNLLKEADDIFINSLHESGLYDSVWQAGAILLPIQTVGVMGDERTYENVVCLRAVTSTDGMTADWAQLPYDFLAKVSNDIINRIKGINRVVYDISSKPPATIEWE